MYQLNQIPFFQEIADSETILLAGAGGGFDFYSAIPLYFSLKKQGKKVILGNLSFTWLQESTAKQVFPYCYKITSGDADLSGRNYFPEKVLAMYMEQLGEEVDIFAFDRIGVQPIKEVYQYLIKEYQIDTVVLVDGGTDSLMFGDEEKLGTPQEDITSMAAVYQCGIEKQYLLSVGFGVDHFHGVSHFRFLENVAKIAKEGGYLGMFQMMKEMEETQKYINAVYFANKQMKNMESIVANSIVSAAEGEYGDHHRTHRTKGSELWINPLMTIYWCFDLPSVMKHNTYYDYIKDVKSMSELNIMLSEYRRQLAKVRANKQMPI